MSLDPKVSCWFQDWFNPNWSHPNIAFTPIWAHISTYLVPSLAFSMLFPFFPFIKVLFKPCSDDCAQRTLFYSPWIILVSICELIILIWFLLLLSTFKSVIFGCFRRCLKKTSFLGVFRSRKAAGSCNIKFVGLFILISSFLNVTNVPSNEVIISFGPVIDYTILINNMYL